MVRQSDAPRMQRGHNQRETRRHHRVPGPLSAFPPFAASLFAITAGGGGLSDLTPAVGTSCGAYAPAFDAKTTVGTVHTQDSDRTPAIRRGRVCVSGATTPQRWPQQAPPYRPGRVCVSGATALRSRPTIALPIVCRVFASVFSVCGDRRERPRRQHVIHMTTPADAPCQGAVSHSASTERFGPHRPTTRCGSLSRSVC
jgi:hypothetical protein